MVVLPRQVMCGIFGKAMDATTLAQCEVLDIMSLPKGTRKISRLKFIQ